MRTFIHKNKAPLIVLALIAIAVITTLLSGCGSTPAKVAFGTLESIGIAENGSMVVAAKAEAQHQITDAQWQQIADAHAKFIAAYDAACDAAAVSLDQASVPANVASLEADVVNLVASFVQPAK